MRAQEVPSKYQAGYAKAMTGRDRISAIKMYCLACCRWQRLKVKLCTCHGCPLYLHRLTGRKIPKDHTPAPVPDKRLYLDRIGRWEGIYRRALTGRDIAASIRAACGLCSCWRLTDQEDPGGGVTDCWDKACPLWLYRLTGRKAPRPKDARPLESDAKRVRIRRLSAGLQGSGRDGNQP